MEARTASKDYRAKGKFNYRNDLEQTKSMPMRGEISARFGS